jgi:hypothetical protein
LQGDKNMSAFTKFRNAVIKGGAAMVGIPPQVVDGARAAMSRSKGGAPAVAAVDMPPTVQSAGMASGMFADKNTMMIIGGIIAAMLVMVLVVRK